jgi:Zn-dependent protease
MSKQANGKNEYRLGEVAGLSLSAEPPALVGSAALFVILGGIAIGIPHMPLGEAAVVSLLAVTLHWVSVVMHQLGHAFAARQTGYPMRGIRLGYLGLLSTSVYPLDEPPLPAGVHVRRALGGPAASLVFSIVAVATLLALLNVSTALGWLGVFFLFDNLVVLGVGSFLPLGFTDGSTLLRLRGKD